MKSNEVKSQRLIIRTGRTFAVVVEDFERFQTTIDLILDESPAARAFVHGVGRRSVQHALSHPRGVRYRTLAEIGRALDMTPAAVRAARSRAREDGHA